MPVATETSRGDSKGDANGCGKSCRVLVVDDHAAMRRALVELIETDEALKVCAAAASAEEAVELLAGCHPHVAVVDLSLPGMNGIELTRILHQRFPEMPVVVVSSHSPTRFEQAALEAGARAYIVKREAAANLVGRIRSALAEH